MAYRTRGFQEISSQVLDACKTDDVASIARLVARASDTDSRYTMEDILASGLRYAPQCNATGILAYLIEHGADVRSLRGYQLISNFDNSPPSRKLLELLLSQGWDINSGEASISRAPLLWKIMEDHQLVEWCLDHGASVHLPASDSEDNRAMRRPILLIATRHGNLSTFELLRSRGAPLCPEILPEAVTMGVYAAPAVGETSDQHFKDRMDFIRHLIDVVGIDVNTNAVYPGSSCATPLCRIACLPKNDPKELIWLLLDYGGDPNRGGVPEAPSFATSAFEGAKLFRNTRFIEAVEEWQSKHAAGVGVSSATAT